jgi:hypothetical protein
MRPRSRSCISSVPPPRIACADVDERGQSEPPMLTRHRSASRAPSRRASTRHPRPGGSRLGARGSLRGRSLAGVFSADARPVRDRAGIVLRAAGISAGARESGPLTTSHAGLGARRACRTRLRGAWAHGPRASEARVDTAMRDACRPGVRGARRGASVRRPGICTRCAPQPVRLPGPGVLVAGPVVVGARPTRLRRFFVQGARGALDRRDASARTSIVASILAAVQRRRAAATGDCQSHEDQTHLSQTVARPAAEAVPRAMP